MRRLALVLVLLLTASACALVGSDDTTDGAVDSGTPPATEPTSETTSTAAPADPAAGTEPGDTTGDAGPGAAVAPVAWSPCPDGPGECGSVTVPVDHDDPAGPTLDLALIRIPATGPADGVRGSIFVNPGGPGGSGFDQVQNGFRFDPAIMDVYHLVGFDPRGVGRSGGLGCFWDRADGPLADHSPDDADEREALDAEAAAVADACAASDGELLPHLNTDAVARDLDLLRQAVGDERLHYYGFSYGTLIGLVYADRFPERVGHLGLDGVVDPTHGVVDLLTQQAGAFESSFEIMDDACGRDLDCPAGGLAQAHDRLVARLEADGPEGGLGQTEAEIAALVSQYDQELWPIYADAMTEAVEDGDFGRLELLNDFFVSSIAFTEYVSVVCIDSPRPSDAREWEDFAAGLAADHPRFGAVIANEVRACAHWSVPAAPRREPVVAAGSAPILVIGNTNDAATPLENAEVVAATLESASLVVLEADGHTAYNLSGCVRALVTDYFVDDVVPNGTTRC